MKFSTYYIALSLLTSFTTFTFPPHVKAQVSYQLFYDNLDPYGQWVDYPGYDYVWIPYAGPDFFPYASSGHWTYTNYGWTWISYYSWGWAPFHYGRWSYDDYFGWFWIPGDVWGPAWVAWRSCPGYYGWAPLGPTISVNVVIGNGYNAPYDQWVFIPDQYMGRHDIGHYYGPRKNNQSLLNSSTSVNTTYIDKQSNATYIAGPRPETVQKATGTPIKAVEIKETTQPGASLKNNQLAIYKPAISRVNEKNAKPAKITDKREVKPPSERINPDEKEKGQNKTGMEQSNKQQEKNQPSQEKNNIKNKENKIQPTDIIKKNPTLSNGEKEQQKQVKEQPESEVIKPIPKENQMKQKAENKKYEPVEPKKLIRNEEPPKIMERKQPKQIRQTEPDYNKEQPPHIQQVPREKRKEQTKRPN